MPLALLDPLSRLHHDRPDGERLFTVGVDPDGLVRCATAGFWSVEDAQAYILALRQAIGAARDGFGRVRLLIDVRQSALHAPDVSDCFLAAEPTLLMADDRRAFLVATNLRRMQLRRIISHRNSDYFLTLGEAEDWLAR